MRGKVRTVDGAAVGRRSNVAVGGDLDDGVASRLVEPGELLVVRVGQVEAASLLAVVAVPRPTTPLPPPLGRAHPLMTAMPAHTHR